MNRFKECRNAKGYTLKEAGKIIGVADSTLSLYETETRTPDINTVARIADAYGVSIDYLTGRTNIKDEPIDKLDIDKELLRVLTNLTESEAQRVRDFVAGMKSNK